MAIPEFFLKGFIKIVEYIDITIGLFGWGEFGLMDLDLDLDLDLNLGSLK